LRIISGPKWDEIIGRWRKLHNMELHDLHPVPNIIIMIKSKRMKRADYVERMEEKRNAYRVPEYVKERDHKEDLEIDGRMLK
jgi:hypothetical protein